MGQRYRRSAIGVLALRSVLVLSDDMGSYGVGNDGFQFVYDQGYQAPLDLAGSQATTDYFTSQVGQHLCDGREQEWSHCEDAPLCQACSPIDCLFSHWSNWYPGGGCVGLKFRHRSIAVNNNRCGLPCYGNTIESQPFPQPQCSAGTKDCIFSVWSEWSACADEMDQSVRSRRIETPPTAGGQPCKGTLKETRPCGGPDSEPCVLSPWHEWTACSTSCGEGRHTRMRRIESEDVLNGQTCDDTLLETDTCQIQPCPSNDCVIGAWSAWSSCLSHYGQTTRHRQVLQSPEGDGLGCNATLVETAGCPKPGAQDCALSDWEPWFACDKSCHGGQTFRIRRLLHPSAFGGRCSEQSLRETAACNTVPCQQETNNCVIGDWADWGACSTQSGPGIKTRKRAVTLPATGDGAPCEESGLEEIMSCEVAAVSVVDCLWGEWNGWSDCSLSCGGGIKTRGRHIVTAPQNGGRACDALDKAEVAPCNVQSCGSECRDGTWGDWMDWTTCSATCSSAYRSRRRIVESLPDACGRMPDGIREEFQLCSGLPSCIPNRDCQLSAWEAWSSCSSSCFGVRERNRRISVYATGNGTSCDAASLRTVEPCNPGLAGTVPDACSQQPPTDCVIEDWQDWTVCSASCGGGQRSRIRGVIQPSANGGEPCSGDLESTQGCSSIACSTAAVKDCVWAPWSDWSTCSQCKGQRYRRRNIQQLPSENGKLCDLQSAHEVSSCTGDCSQVRFCSWSDWSAAQCPSVCGSSTAQRNRAMQLLSSADDFLFKGDVASNCQGSQLGVTKCPVQVNCTEACIPQDCTFGAWSEWTAPACLGLCERQRVIATLNNECGSPCDGPLQETKHCNSICDQAIDCKISEWSQWSTCQNATAKQPGQHYRSRMVLQKPQKGGLACSGDLLQTKSCLSQMPAPCVFGDWQEWETCSVSCGQGQQDRKRLILRTSEDGGEQCHGPLTQVRGCSDFSPTLCKEFIEQDCEFADWNSWSECGYSMQRERTRDFLKQAQVGGLPCFGPMQETEACQPYPVDCLMSGWTSWDTCSKTCGAGQVRRQRQIQQFPQNGGSLCPEDLVQTKGCNKEPCHPRDCQVSGWLDWSVCSVTCGNGHQTRSRSILDLRQAGGYGCFFSLAENRACGGFECASDCKWSAWDQWSGCTKSCGGGIMKRTRFVANVPGAGGAVCDQKDMEEILPCNLGECNQMCVDGLWGDWQEWAPCSVSCAGGETFRRREVRRMANECGTPAQGDDREVKFCNTDVPCHQAQDCLFSAWREWNVCSASCDGVRMRKRNIAEYGHGGGLFCVGPTIEIAPCNPDYRQERPAGCSLAEPVDCILSEWSMWKECSATCGGGETTRSRTILQHPKHGGFGCQSALMQVAECARSSCGGPGPMDCVLGDWRSWAVCGACDGQRKRYRSVLVYPANGGKSCPYADEVEVGVCPHVCNTQLSCTWTGWSSWGSCSTSCGTGGRRKRERALELIRVPVADQFQPGGLQADLIQRYDAAIEPTQDLGMSNHDVVLAFISGCVSLAAVGFVLRPLGSAILGPLPSSRGVSRARSEADRLERGHAARGYVSETELPLVGSAGNL